jgi:glycosyltransferase involved in cell wall biosynthesis
MSEAPARTASTRAAASGPIVVATLTYNRPAGLARLLDRLEHLAFAGEAPALAVVVVDNSADGNARAAVSARAAGYRFPLHYAHAAERGIAQARNRALAEATRLGARRLAFIDDDEYPEPGWLDAMLRVADETGAEVVVGALLPDFDTPPPAWLDRGGFLAIAAHGDGAAVPVGNTSNVLFDLAFANRHQVRFDTRFALTGGEDTLFFDDLKRCGARLVFCRSGVVHETIAPQRRTLRWNARRWTRSGNTDGRIVMRRDPGPASRWGRVLVGGLVRLGVGAALTAATAPLALVGRGHVPAEHLRVACRGLGFLRAASGSVIEEYRTHDR